MGKLIVIEGGDGVGKETQAKLAVKALEKKFHEVLYLDFPQYRKTMAAGAVREALDGALACNGEVTDFRHVHPKLASFPYTLDRLKKFNALWHAKVFTLGILNRYVPSNAMFQGAKFLKREDQDAFIDWLERLEYEEYELPRPNLVLYLHVPYGVARELAKGRGALDQHEADEAYQRAVINLYLRTARARPGAWRVIECAENGAMRSREAIHADVMREIDSVL